MHSHLSLSLSLSCSTCTKVFSIISELPAVRILYRRKWSFDCQRYYKLYKRIIVYVGTRRETLCKVVREREREREKLLGSFSRFLPLCKQQYKDSRSVHCSFSPFSLPFFPYIRIWSRPGECIPYVYVHVNSTYIYRERERERGFSNTVQPASFKRALFACFSLLYVRELLNISHRESSYATGMQRRLLSIASQKGGMFRFFFHFFVCFVQSS